MSQGKIVQVIGAVVDVEFPRDAIPHVYDALKLDENGLTLEVQQLLGDGVVRTIAMGSSDGLKRGMSVSNTGAPITVPVGKGTLGRIVDDWVHLLMKQVRSIPTRAVPFTKLLQNSTSCLQLPNCWKPVLR